MSMAWRHIIYQFWLILPRPLYDFVSRFLNLQTLITLELEQILRNGKRQSSWFLKGFQIEQ